MELLYQRGTSFLRLLGTGLVWLLLLSPGAGQSQVSRIVAVVDNQIVTTLEITWLVRYRGFRIPVETQEKNAFYDEILNQLINQKLIVKETARTPFIDVNSAQLAQYLESFRSQFPTEAAFQAKLSEIGVGKEDLLEILKRQIIVNRFIELRFEPFIIVLPDEIEVYYENELLPELQQNNQLIPELSVVEETIRQILTVRKTTEELERWVRSTRANSKIEVLLDRQPSTTPNIPDGYPWNPQFGPLELK